MKGSEASSSSKYGLLWPQHADTVVKQARQWLSCPEDLTNLPIVYRGTFQEPAFDCIMVGYGDLFRPQRLVATEWWWKRPNTALAKDSRPFWILFNSIMKDHRHPALNMSLFPLLGSTADNTGAQLYGLREFRNVYTTRPSGASAY